MKSLLTALFCLLLANGCASRPVHVNWQQQQTTALTWDLQRLAKSIEEQEAVRFADAAVRRSAELSSEYRAVSPPWVHNFLVNGGLRDRGLCYEWTNDLYPALYAVKPPALQLHLAVAHMDTRREHNCIVVTARDQPFATGIVLDAWRRSGRLWFGPVATDKKYPWKPLPADRIPKALKTYFPTDAKPAQ